MKLSIIIVSWNVRAKLKENLRAIYKSEADFSFEVFVVDNDSSDGSAEMVRKEFTTVKLIANKENLGFARANNQAIKKAKGEFILLLNPDMRPQLDTFKKMLEFFLRQESALVAGCRLLDLEGKNIKHVRRFPQLWDQALIALKIPHFFPSLLGGYLCNSFDYTREEKVDSIRGGFFMINAKKLGTWPFLDERYFLWFEEVDFCRQIKQSGGEVWYYPGAECVDYVGQSFKQLARLKAQLIFRHSQLEYFKKWHGFLPVIILSLVWLPGLFFSYCGEKLGLKSRART